MGYENRVYYRGKLFWVVDRTTLSELGEGQVDGLSYGSLSGAISDVKSMEEWTRENPNDTREAPIAYGYTWVKTTPHHRNLWTLIRAQDGFRLFGFAENEFGPEVP